MIRELSVTAGSGLAGASQTQFTSQGVGGGSSPLQLNGFNQEDGFARDAVKVSLSQASEVFPEEDGKKKEVTEAAIQGRSIKDQLVKANAVLDEMSAQLEVAKNYPPFPPGNEERVQYVKSLDALNKQLQSLTIPSVSAEFEPVFYPREDVFPPLDAKVPSDAAVLAFGDAVLAVKDELGTARAALEAQLAKVAEKAGYSAAVKEDAATEISQAVAGQMQGKAISLTTGTDIYTQI